MEARRLYKVAKGRPGGCIEEWVICERAQPCDSFYFAQQDLEQLAV